MSRARSAAPLGAPLVLVLDVGTSSCRASVYDVHGERVPGLAEQVRYSPRTTADGGADLDADTLFAHVCEALDAIVGRAAVGIRTRISAVALTTFWHSLLGIDSAGRPLTPVYLWMDGRSSADATALQGILDGEAVHARTGCPLHPSYWPAKLNWIRRTRPLIAARAARWVSFGEYVSLRLFGATGVTVSMASGTGLLDRLRLDWDEPLLEACATPVDRLSPLASSQEPRRGLRGEMADRWPALRDVPWFPAVGDGGTSNLGAGCATRERMALMVGTSGALRVAGAATMDRPAVPPGLWEYRVDPHRVVLGGALNDGGSLMDWLRRTLRLGPRAEWEAAVAALPPDGHGLTVLPFWAGERSTGWAPDARGSIVGMRLHSSPAELLRACMEGVAFRFGHIAKLLGEAAPAARQVVATGSALLNSPAWLQVMADVLALPVAASAVTEGSSRGTALLTLETLGLLSAPLEQVPAPLGRVYEPIPAHTDLYREAALRQERLYALLISPGVARPTAIAGAPFQRSAPPPTGGRIR